MGRHRLAVHVERMLAAQSGPAHSCVLDWQAAAAAAYHYQDVVHPSVVHLYADVSREPDPQCGAEETCDAAVFAAQSVHHP